MPQYSKNHDEKFPGYQNPKNRQITNYLSNKKLHFNHFLSHFSALLNTSSYLAKTLFYHP